MIGPGTPTGTFTDPNVQFIGEKQKRYALVAIRQANVGCTLATLVEGPSDAVLQGSIPGGPAFSYSCAIAGSQANCQLVASDSTMTETTSIIEIVSPFVVQGGDSSSSSINSRLPSSTVTSMPLSVTSSPLSTAPIITTPSSDLPPQPTVTSSNSAHTRNHQTSWIWLVFGLMHAYHM